MSLKTIYYRGFLKSCNYNCPYCPFHKISAAEENLKYDREALEQFCKKAPSLGENLSVMLVPYGEAMIHSYYYEAVKKLCKADNIDKAGFQSNLSFSTADFFKYIKDLGGGCRKLKLWCSFHPCCADLDQFLEKCLLLYQEKIAFSVGAVGIPKNAGLLSQLRRRLPPDVYMWVNAAEGMKRKYTQDEIDEFARIDPLFLYELKIIPANADLCSGGKESLFIEADGAAYACPISKNRLGNIYSEDLTQILARSKICIAGYCHCYLAYSLRKDIFNPAGFDAAFRLPQVYSLHSKIDH